MGNGMAKKREWAFDETSVRDGVIVRIDQVLYHPYLSHYIDLLVIRLLQGRIMPAVSSYVEEKGQYRLNPQNIWL